MYLIPLCLPPLHSAHVVVTPSFCFVFLCCLPCSFAVGCSPLYCFCATTPSASGGTHSSLQTTSSLAGEFPCSFGPLGCHSPFSFFVFLGVVYPQYISKASVSTMLLSNNWALTQLCTSLEATVAILQRNCYLLVS